MGATQGQGLLSLTIIGRRQEKPRLAQGITPLIADSRSDHACQEWNEGDGFDFFRGKS